MSTSMPNLRLHIMRFLGQSGLELIIEWVSEAAAAWTFVRTAALICAGCCELSMNVFVASWW